MATELGGSNLLNYVENYCWVQGTIPISHAANVPQNEEQWAEIEDAKMCKRILTITIHLLCAGLQMLFIPTLGLLMRDY